MHHRAAFRLTNISSKHPRFRREKSKMHEIKHRFEHVLRELVNTYACGDLKGIYGGRKEDAEGM